jgi:hypothetical protein
MVMPIKIWVENHRNLETFFFYITGIQHNLVEYYDIKKWGIQRQHTNLSKNTKNLFGKGTNTSEIKLIQS